MDYEKIRDDLQTGDIILFSGNSMVSGAIKLFSRSEWSHVAMVVKDPISDIVYCWESTSLVDDKDGVQISVLSKRIKEYDGYVAFRHLKGRRTKATLSALGAFRKAMKGRKYETSKVELFKSAWDGWGGENKEDLSTVFCSELIAEAYQEMNILTENKPSNEFTPDDFAKMVRLRGKWSLGGIQR